MSQRPSRPEPHPGRRQPLSRSDFRRRSPSRDSIDHRSAATVEDRKRARNHHREYRAEYPPPTGPRRGRNSPPPPRRRNEYYDYDPRAHEAYYNYQHSRSSRRTPPRNRSASPSDLISALASGKPKDKTKPESDLLSTQPHSRRISPSPPRGPRSQRLDKGKDQSIGDRTRDRREDKYTERRLSGTNHEDDDMYGRGGPPRGPYHDPRYAQPPHYSPQNYYNQPGQSPYGRDYHQQSPYGSHQGSPTHGYSPQQTPSYHGYPQANSPYYQNHQHAHHHHQQSQYPTQMPHGRGQPPPQAPRGPTQRPPPAAPSRASKGKAGHFSNLSWTPGAGRGEGSVDSSKGSPPPAPTGPRAERMGEEDEDSPFRPPRDMRAEEDDPFRPPKSFRANDEDSILEAKQTQVEEDNPFRPPRDLRAEDEMDSKAMPPPPPKVDETESGRKPISFTIKGAADKKEPVKAQPTIAVRMVKELVIQTRRKPRPELIDEHRASDSVYYRKTGNESVVGSGTYGKVYKAIHVYTKDEVALKKIRMEGERDGFPVTAIREIKLLQSLKHINVVALQEVMVEKNDCFMVFEYLAHDLTGLLNHPSFSLTDAHKKDLAKQMFEGLEYLHRRGVLHRDIKAANILVSKQGALKLADFGLARFYSKNRKQDYTNRVVTIWYRSPELLLGETQYGPAVDIWSAACVLVEIFTRHAIFPGDGGEINQLDKIYNVLGTPSRSVWPGIIELQWYELLRPVQRVHSTFAEKYKHRITPDAFALLEAMFAFDPEMRPAATDVLEHPYFTVEEPRPARVVELAAVDGDWHEFESKQLRKERDREARRREKEEMGQKRKDGPASEGQPENKKVKV